MKNSLKILILEDVPTDAELMEEELRSAGIEFTSRRVDNRNTFEEALEIFAPDVILSDYSLPRFDGKSALTMVRAKALAVPFIFVTGALGEERAVDLLKEGGTDFVLKDRLARLPLCVKRALEEFDERRKRRHAEESLRLAHAELERKVQEMQSFTFAASHDLQEPLRKIQTFGTLLAEKGADRLNEQERDYLSRMTGAAGRMQELLDALLKYSRVETNGQGFRPVKLVEMAKDGAQDLEVTIQKLGARLEIGHLPTVRSDPYQLRLLFQNLFANALKYHRSEVKPLIRVYAEESPGDCRIFVEDNGIGFDEKYLENIFQPFQRLHGRNEYPGTGMGLAICKKIVERHGGTITAKSTPGKGSTFIVTLPRDRQS